MLLLSGSESINWTPRYQVGGKHQDHPSPTGTGFPALRFLPDGEASTPLKALMKTESVTHRLLPTPPMGTCPKSKYWKGLGLWNQTHLGVALHFTCSVDLGQVISNL